MSRGYCRGQDAVTKKENVLGHSSMLTGDDPLLLFFLSVAPAPHSAHPDCMRLCVTPEGRSVGYKSSLNTLFRGDVWGRVQRCPQHTSESEP